DINEFGVFTPGLETLVALLSGGIAPNIDECVRSADSQFGVALLGNPITHIGDSVPRENSGCAICKALRERIPLSGLRCVHAQLKEPRGLSLLSVAPAYSGYAECRPDNRGDFPLQHESLLLVSTAVIIVFGFGAVNANESGLTSAVHL